MKYPKLFQFFILLFGLLLAACQAVPLLETTFLPASLRFSGERAFELESDFVTRFLYRHSGQPTTGWRLNG